MDCIRNPKQPRAIEKKEKIIKSGLELICKYGYYNTNTKEIAKNANVSTGIVYQYFKDKHDIFIEAINKYGDDIFFPFLNNQNIDFDINDFEIFINNIINYYIENHKVSKIAHEEITAMIHTDKLIAQYYYKKELEMTYKIKNFLLSKNFKDNNLFEKAHIAISMIDNLCHEVIYHNHDKMDYNVMTKIVINCIKNIFKNDLN